MNQHVCCPGCEPDAHIAHPFTPRVAESLDDLRVGMVVVLNRSLGRRVGTVRSVGNGGAMLQLDGDDLRSQSAFAFSVGEWVILSDPPPVPVRVPADLIDALAHSVEVMTPTFASSFMAQLWYDAKALVDAARNGTDQ